MPQEYIKMPSQDMLNKIFRYDEGTGMLFYRHNPDFSPEWNEEYEGMNACSVWMDGEDELVMLVPYPIKKGREWTLYPAERIVVKMLWNRNPKEIDHLNDSKLDNTPHNLDFD